MKDKAIVDAVCELGSNVLVEQRKRPDLAPLLAQAMAGGAEEGVSDTVSEDDNNTEN